MSSLSRPLLQTGSVNARAVGGVPCQAGYRLGAEACACGTLLSGKAPAGTIKLGRRSAAARAGRVLSRAALHGRYVFAQTIQFWFFP